MIGLSRRIQGDLFDVAARIREIDEAYFVVYSYPRKRYEVHSARQRGNTLCLVLPYPTLDERAVRLVRKTRVERMDEVLRQMEEDNAKREKQHLAQAVKQGEKAFEQALRNPNGKGEDK